MVTRSYVITNVTPYLLLESSLIARAKRAISNEESEESDKDRDVRAKRAGKRDRGGKAKDKPVQTPKLRGRGNMWSPAFLLSNPKSKLTSCNLHVLALWRLIKS